MSTEWFRNTTWNDVIERAFFERLSRARRKEQYIRIQACTLAMIYPQVAIDLLDRYFKLPDDFDHAQAYVDQATAFLALGRLPEAITSYERALTRETDFPTLLTDAYIALPFLIATREVREKFPRAVDLLNQYKHRLAFPLDHFRWHGALAFIADSANDCEQARTHAALALEAADLNRSGFRNHPQVGLVTKDYQSEIQRLNAILTALPSVRPPTR